MTYSSLMVHLDLGISNEALLQVTAALAERFDARVIGIAAYAPLLITYSDGYVSGQVIEQDRATMEQMVREGEAQFHAAMARRVKDAQWRTTTGYGAPSSYIAEQARAADLVIIEPKPESPLFAPSRRVDTGDLVMQAGRPILVVPNFIDHLNLDHVIIGWKDTGETRRAVADALPLLLQAGGVTVVEIADSDGLSDARSNVRDVAAWLKTHGIPAAFEAVERSGSDEACLQGFAAEKRAGVLITGAYGHNRVREWVFGGVTRDLLQRPARCSFLSH